MDLVSIQKNVETGKFSLIFKGDAFSDDIKIDDMDTASLKRMIKDCISLI